MDYFLTFFLGKEKRTPSTPLKGPPQPYCTFVVVASLRGHIVLLDVLSNKTEIYTYFGILSSLFSGNQVLSG